MKLKKLIFIFVCFFITSVNANALDFDVGTYVSDDGHKIIINEDNTIKYDDTYSLTLKKSEKGSTITGKIGTDNKNVTFYQINDTKIISSTVMSYKHDGTTVYLYDYEVFSMDNVPLVDDSGKIELWKNNSKVNSYNDLQSAIDSASNGDIIKITDSIDIVGGVYIDNKEITIDGLDNTLNVSMWLNSVFVIGENATLNVKNLNIEGGATGFAVDYSAPNIKTGTTTTIPLIANSDKTDPKRNISIFISKGNLNIIDSDFNNNYGVNGSVINVVTGNLKLETSNFNHNRATTGGSLYIGSNFKSGQTNYSINDIQIKDCNFLSNYSNNGGAIYVYNVEKMNILNSNFKKNTVTGGKGGAILFNQQSKRVSEEHNLNFPILEIDNALFEENWAGNDGFAIENHEAASTIKNTIFRKNVGIHSTSSCGTISFSVSEILPVPQVIENCLFEENLGSASTLADHATYIKLNVSNTKFVRNKAVYNSMLLYSSDAVFDNCEFENEYVSRAIVDIISFDTKYYDDLPRKLVFKDVTFKNTQHKGNDILIRKLNNNVDYFNSIVVIEGNTSANIEAWQGSEVVVKGNLTGNIDTDKFTQNIVVEETGKVNGKININENSKTITLIFDDIEKIDGYYWETRKFIYTDKDNITRQEFFLKHLVEIENYTLEYYTDKDFQNKWDYSVNEDISIYGKWVEHTHEYNGKYTTYEQMIYEQCECGHLNKSISLGMPNDNNYTGNEIAVIVKNDIGITNDKYEIAYYKKNGEQWEEIEETPSDVGIYKAVLTLEDNFIEQVYEILPQNPSTIDNIELYIVIFIISTISVITFSITIKNY